MEALTSLSNKFFTRNVEKILSPSRSTLLGRYNNNFLTSASFKKVHFDDLVLFPSTVARWLTKSHLSSDAEVFGGSEAAVSGLQKLMPSKNVRVRFQLLKMCMYGEQFLLVGDNPMFGSWDPLCAIPMNWSDGHLWTVELDLPIELTIQFKFVLKRSTGEVLWQPGPDRIFKTWKNKNTIVIREDWDNAGAQKIKEEQVFNQIEDSTINPNLELLGGHTPNAEDKPKPDINYELITRSNVTHPEECIGVRKEEQMQNSNSITPYGKNQATVQDQMLPCLSPLQMVSTEELLSRDFESIIGDISIGVDSAKD